MNLSNIKKNTNFFSFTDTVAHLAVNKEFTKGYETYVEEKKNAGYFSMYVNEDSYIWHALSAIGENISESIYSNILNYINNIGNIDTCTVKALMSMAKVLGIEKYNFIENIDSFPTEILDLMDIFSINRSYLKNSGYVDPLTINEFEKAGIYERNNTFNKSALNNTELSNNKFEYNFNNEKYDDFVVSAFYTVLSSNVFLRYRGHKGDSRCIILHSLSNIIMPQDSNNITNYLNINACYSADLIELKKKYGIENFNPDEIVDKIESGKDKLSRYVSKQRDLLETIINFRRYRYNGDSNLVKPNNNWHSIPQYVYYDEKKVLNYFKFVSEYGIAYNLPNINNETGIDDLRKLDLEKIFNYSQWKDYKLNSDFVEISSNYINSFNVLKSDYASTVLSATAISLKNLCFFLVDVREKLKTQSQKNHMRGSFLLLSYIINEYLRKTLPIQFPIPALKEYLSSYGNDGIYETYIDIKNYTDYTEYFNLQTDTSRKTNEHFKETNPKFWQNEIELEGIGFAMKQIDKFYLDVLDLSSANISASYDFLNTIYELGARRSYYDEKKKAVITEAEIDEKFLEVEQNPSLSNEYNELLRNQEQLYYSYSGLSVGYEPLYNWKNTAHPSYQVHPYLINFVENASIETLVRNAFVNGENEKLLRVLLSPDISVHLSKFGALQNIWLNNAVDFSGYLSRYEKGTHDKLDHYGNLSPMQNYDGLFYPPAVDDYILSATNEDDTSFKALVNSVYNKLTRDDIVAELSSNNPEYTSLSSSIYLDQANYLMELQEFQLSLASLMLSGDVLSDAQEEMRQKIKNKMESDECETFYTKWYSHLNLTKNEAQKIGLRLSAYNTDIVEMYTPVNVGSEVYDMYKYGIDKYGNSLMLFKKYKLDEEQEVKDNTPGRLWIKFESHPIGFPAFGDYGD